METIEINVKIDQPEVKEITKESNPDIWALLEPPKKD